MSETLLSKAEIADFWRRVGVDDNKPVRERRYSAWYGAEPLALRKRRTPAEYRRLIDLLEAGATRPDHLL
jgi:hypothetical protein